MWQQDDNSEHSATGIDLQVADDGFDKKAEVIVAQERPIVDTYEPIKYTRAFYAQLQSNRYK